MAISFLLKQVMDVKGVGTNEMARRIGITKANVSRMRRGDSRGIRFDTLDQICQVLDCAPGDLIKRDTEKK